MVWFLSGVQTHVCLQMMIARKSLPALQALEWFLARVRSLVVLQHVLVAEGSVADVTREHLLLFVWFLLGVGTRGDVTLWR